MTSSRTLVLFSCFLVLRIQTGSSAISKDTQLFNSLIENYDKEAAPTQANGNPTNVKVSVYINELSINYDNSLDMSFDSYIRLTWEDPRLKYPAADNSSKDIRLPEDSWKKIWIPDVFIRNLRSAKVHDFVTPNRRLTLKPSGSVFYVMKVSAVSSCLPPNPRSFLCRLVFESFGYRTDTLTISPVDNPIAFSGDMFIKNARLLDSFTSDCSQNYTSGSYPCLEFSIYFKTDSNEFIVLVILIILVVIASWISFWIDHNATVARVLPGFASFTILTLMAIQRQKNPAMLTYGRLVDVWLLVSCAFVFASLLEYLLVIVLSRSNSNSKGLDFLKPSLTSTLGGEESKAGDDGRRRALWTDWVARILFPAVYLVFVIVLVFIK